MVVHFLVALDNAVAKLDAISGIDRFAQAQTWTRLKSGETVHGGARAWVRCEITERVPAGESTVYIAGALESHVTRNSQPAGSSEGPVSHSRT